MISHCLHDVTMFNYFIILLFAIKKVDWIHERSLYMITDYLTKAGTAHDKGRLWSFISLQEEGPENQHKLSRKREWKSKRKWPWFTFPTERSRVTQTQPKLNTTSLISALFLRLVNILTIHLVVHTSNMTSFAFLQSTFSQKALLILSWYLSNLSTSSHPQGHHYRW